MGTYDPNSLETQKGNIGERIVRKLYEAKGCKVDCLRETKGIYVVDFEVTNENGLINLIEVKTYDSHSDANGIYFTLADDKFNPPNDYAVANGKNLVWAFVDSVTGKVFLGSSYRLINQMTIGNKTYPERINLSPSDGSMPAQNFHVNQFRSVLNIDAEDLAELRAIKLKGDTADEAKPVDLSKPANDGQAVVVQTFSGPARDITLDVWQVGGDDRYFITWMQVKNFFGLKGTSFPDFEPFYEFYRFKVGNMVMPFKFLHLLDVANFCRDYARTQKTNDMSTKKFRRQQNALSLANWVEAEILPSVYGTAPPAQVAPIATKKTEDVLSFLLKVRSEIDDYIKNITPTEVDA